MKIYFKKGVVSRVKGTASEIEWFRQEIKDQRQQTLCENPSRSEKK